MTLTTLIIRIGIVGILLLFALWQWKKYEYSFALANEEKLAESQNRALDVERMIDLKPALYNGHKNWVMAFFQYFCGAWFLFSGYVKAVDPLGTSYKLVDYFNEFKLAFEGTWFSFLAPMFPWIAENFSVHFSVVTIVFEVVLGFMLLLGAFPKFTSWSFFLLMLFFTFLTGFTYLTGYVPGDANFFDFSSWGSYNKTNMRVTDCGCFGDFIKLEPKTSFIKDVFLMIPAFFFIWKFKDMTQLFNKPIRRWSTLLVTITVFIFCMSNYVWDIPSVDFRPFNEGKDVRATKILEEEAFANAPVTYVLENKETKEEVSFPMAEYLTRYKEFPKDKWSVKDQITGEPAVKQTKISEYAIKELEYGDDVAEELLAYDGYSIMMVCYMLKGDAVKKSRTVTDTIFTTDTIEVMDNNISTTQIVKSVKETKERAEEYYKHIWAPEYLEDFKEKILPLSKAATDKGVKMYGVIGKADKKTVLEFKNDTGLDIPLYTSDDILLKTIVRSNPGIVLWKDGKVVKKWHINKLPTFDEMATNYIRL